MENAVFKWVRGVRVRQRAWFIKKEAATYYEGIVHNCARVSANNKSLAFAVHRTGVFHAPRIEPIERPDVVQLSEMDSCVIIKDGVVYELKKETR